MLKLYTEESLLKESNAYIAHVYAAWKEQFSHLYPKNSFKSYIQNAHEYLQFVDDPAEADYLICPRALGDPQNAHELQAVLELSQKTKLHALVLYNGDPTDPLPEYPDITYLRYSSLKSKLTASEIPTPPPVPDHLALHRSSQLTLLEKPTTPIIGFCGQIKPQYAYSGLKGAIQNKYDAARHHLASFPKLYHGLRKLGIRLTKLNGPTLRAQALRVCRGSKALKTNFLIRKTFLNGLFQTIHQEKNPAFTASREDFLQNIENSHYILCPRGQGNYSMRFYETLAMGRIPIFINSDAELPLSHLIDWGKYMIAVEPDQIHTLPERVLAFHEQLSPEAFIQLQKDCRALWENYLSLNGFMQHLHSLLKDRA